MNLTLYNPFKKGNLFAKLFGMGVFLVLGTLTAYLSYQRYLLSEEDRQDKMVAAASAAMARLESSLNLGLSTARTLGFIVERYGYPTNFDSLAAGLQSANPYVDAIELSMQGVITDVYPLQGNESILAHDIMSERKSAESKLDSSMLRSFFFEGPVNLIQGGSGIIGRQPIYSGDKFLGFAIVVIKVPTLLKAAGIGEKDQGEYEYVVTRDHKDREESIFGGTPTEQMQMVEASVPNGHWHVYAGLNTKSTLAFLWPYFLIGFLTSVLAGLLAFQQTSQPLLLTEMVRKKTSELAVSNERYAFVTQATTDAIWDWDIESGKIYWGEGFTLLFGYNKEDMRDDMDSWTRLLHPDDMQRIINGIRACLDGSESHWNDEYRLLKSDGSYAFVLDRGFIIRNDRGKAVRMVGAIKDITDRKAREQELKLFESVIKNTADAVVITEAEPLSEPGPRIVYVNEAFTHMTGYQIDEVLGKTPRMLQGPDSDREETARMSRKLRRWEPVSATLLNYKKNGEEFWVSMNITPVADESGWYTHWIAIQRDVTADKRRESQALLAAQISKTFNEQDELGIAVQHALTYIVDYGKFSMAEIWLVDPDEKEISLRANYIPDDNIVQFYEKHPTFRNLKKGEALPGTIWQRGVSMQWEQTQREGIFRRTRAAVEAGINRIDGIPLLDKGRVVGVLLLGSSQEEKRDFALSVSAEDFSNFLGTEIARKQVEQELTKLFNLVPDMICIADFNGYFRKVNPAMVRILGYSEEELLSRPYNEFLHPDDIPHTTAKTIELQKSGLPGYVENRLITKNGEVRWLAWSVVLSLTEETIFATAKDITEVQDLQRLVNRAAEMARFGAWEVIEQDKTLQWSDFTYEVMGVPRDYDLSITKGMDLLTPDSQVAVRHAIDQLRVDGLPFDIELELQYGDTSRKWVRCQAQPEFINGVRTRIIGSFQDITQTKNYISKIEEHNRELNEIAWMQAHEVRGPLARIMGLINVLGNPQLSEADKTNALNHMQQATREFDGIIKRIVDKSTLKKEV